MNVMADIGEMRFESVVRPEHRDFYLVDSLCARFTDRKSVV